MTAARGTVLALDVGERRVGIARAELSAGFASPLTTLVDPDSFIGDIADLCKEEVAAGLVIGLPRGLDGQDTAQTRRVRAFAEELAARLAQANQDIPVYWVDEALTSVKAESELQTRGKPYARGDIDALAATYILEDYLEESRQKNHD